MEKAAYTQLLSKSERAAAMKFGAALALQQSGVPLRHADNVKQAFQMPSVSGALDNVSKAIVATSLIAGVPIGIAAHMVGRGISSNRRKEREQLARIKYYRDATRQLESGLTGVPEPQVVQ
jgi:hypothetical protein